MTPKAKYYETLANTMIKNFEKRRMEAYYCPTAKEAVEKALSFLPSGAVVEYFSGIFRRLTDSPV